MLDTAVRRNSIGSLFLAAALAGSSTGAVCGQVAPTASGPVPLVAVPPGWLSPRNLSLALVGMLLGAGLSLRWGFALRRRVQEQARTLRREREERVAVEQRYRSLVENAPDIIFTLDLEQHVTSLNPTGERFLGYSTSERASLDFIDLCRPADREPLRAWMADALVSKTVQTREIVLLPKQGGPVTLEASVMPVTSAGLPLGVLAVARDITERKQLETEREGLIGELKEALANLKTLSGLVPICASCKKIRDDGGYWNMLESYISRHSDARFSHSICPDCVKELYPEIHASLPPEQRVSRLALSGRS